MHVLLSLSATASDVLAAVPNPGQGEAPPGINGFLTILKWAAYIGLGVCVAGIIGAGAAMAWQNRHGGEGAQHAGRLAWVLAGAMVIGGASGLVTAVL